jgi:membrane-associated phospholipid phosphatase
MRVCGFVLLGFLAFGHLGPRPSLLAQTPDPHTGLHPLITREGVALAGLVLVMTAMGDQGLRGEFQEHRGNTSNSVAELGNALGDPRYLIPAFGGVYLMSQLTGDQTLGRAALHAGEAALLAGGLATALKFAIGRGRPGQSGDADGFRPFSGWNSFPSGHTTLAFAVATAIADETPDRWSDIALYGAAAATAFARVNDDRHWASDVLAGALVGHLSARWLSRRSRLTPGPGALGIKLEF